MTRRRRDAARPPVRRLSDLLYVPTMGAAEGLLGRHVLVVRWFSFAKDLGGIVLFKSSDNSSEGPV